MCLESSLNRIFQATVNDILDSVERTLSEYQGAIQTIQTENEGLKRLLFAQRSAESDRRGPQFVCYQSLLSCTARTVCVCALSFLCVLIQKSHLL